MFKATAIGLLLAAGLGPILTGLAREIAHRRRKRADGMGGTQDIALIGSLATLACLLGAAVVVGLWLASR